MASELLGGAPQVPSGTGRSEGSLTLAPPPVFPARPAVPGNNVDVMVWRDSQVPDQALAFAMHLLSADVQDTLAPFDVGLALRPGQATAYLSARRGVQGPQWIASPEYDMTAEDAYGTETDENSTTITLVRGALTSALRDLTGVAGGFYQMSAFLAHLPGIDVLPGMQFLPDGASFPPGSVSCKGFVANPPAGGDVQQALAQYASQALGG